MAPPGKDPTGKKNWSGPKILFEIKILSKIELLKVKEKEAEFLSRDSHEKI